MRVGINGSDKLLAPDLGAISADIVQTEADGFDSYWMAQTTLLDAISGLAIAASGSRTITVGTAVVPTWTRHPQAMAAAALTAQAATGGRFVLGIGLLHKPVVEDYFHMTRRPLLPIPTCVSFVSALIGQWPDWSMDGTSGPLRALWIFEGPPSLILPFRPMRLRALRCACMCRRNPCPQRRRT